MRPLIACLFILIAAAGFSTSVTTPSTTAIRGNIFLNLTATQTGIGFTYTTTGVYYPYSNGSVAQGCQGITCGTTGTMTILTTGVYEVVLNTCYSINIASALIEATLMVDGVPSSITCPRTSANNVINCDGVSGFLSLTAGNVLSVSYRANQTGQQGAIKSMSVMLHLEQ